MTEEWRDRILREHERELDSWWEDESAAPIMDDDEFDSTARANFLEGVRYYDPNAHLTEEMHVRLSGEGARGTLGFELSRRLLKPIEDGVDASADGEVRLELANILPGSTVLVVRPAQRPDTDSDSLSPVDTSAADQGARNWLRLVGAAERGEDLREWSRAFDALDRLVKVLNDFSLNLGFTWLAPGGPRRRARLTEQGRAYVHEMSSGTTEAVERTVGGYVVELKASGHVGLKAAPRRGATAYDIRFERPEELIALNLQLGQTVWFVVREDTTTDRVQRVLDTRFTFVRVEARDQPVV